MEQAHSPESISVLQQSVDEWFTHHPPKDEATVERYAKIRHAGKMLAYAIVENTPKSADQSAAIRKVREAVMTANAAIACGGSK